MDKASLRVEPLRSSANDRLESWKEIAAHLQRSVRTAKRWERVEGLPVHRHAHNRAASVYAYRSELEAWWVTRQPRLAVESDSPAGESLRQVLLQRVPCLATASFLVLLFYLVSHLMLK